MSTKRRISSGTGRAVATFSVALALSLVCAAATARPGGGSGFSGRSSSSSRSGSSSSSSSSGSRSSSSSGSRSTSSSSSSSGGSKSSYGSSRSGSSSSSSSSSGSTYTPSKPSIPVVSYCTTAGADRPALRHWQPGMLGPYGPGPARPAQLRVEKPGDLAVGATLLMILGSLTLVMPMLVIGGVVMLFRKRRGNGWTTAAARPAQYGAAPPPPSGSGNLRRALASLRAADPDFSVGLFEDFAYALYAEAHTARGAKTLGRLAPYVRPQARTALEALGSSPVSAIVVGAMRYAGFNPNAGGGAHVEVTVEFEACYTETAAGSQPRSFYAAEQWRFVRSRAARSRPPEKIRVFNCPSCGAPLDKMMGGTCGYCNKAVEAGAFDWAVDSVVVQEREPRPPVLTGSSEEVGTDFPTIFDPGLAQHLAALKARDPAVDDQALMTRVGLVFRTMQTAWASLNWESARPYLTDNLFQTNAYWISAYRAQGLRNVTENVQVQRIELVRVESDKWFDAFTVRIHATGLDYTLRDADGAVVGGSRQKPRPYTEYWTFVRGTSHRGPAQTQPVCPSCGGPMNVSMAARCSHCGVKVNSGEFDWVLSRIEQDEVYGG